MNYDPNETVPQPRAGYFKFVVKTVMFKKKDASGIYYEIKEDVDKNGKPYMKPTLSVCIPGSDFTWSCKPFLSTHPKMVFKLNHLREIAGDSLKPGEFNPETLVEAEGWGQFAVCTDGYSDLDLIDFLPERKIAGLPDMERAIFDMAVKAYGETQTVPAAEGDDDIPF
jgi:hypothetical protein